MNVKQDGTCIVNGFCRPNDNGIATVSTTGCCVVDVINDSMVKIIFK
jgi:hypothetical protein